MCWFYQGKCLEEIPEDTIYGFIYKITRISDGKFYIGKKAFLYNIKKKISKRVIKKTATRKRVERVKKDSGWQNYWGSSKSLLSDIKLLGKDKFKREIITFAHNKAQLSFLEISNQIVHKVMIVDSYNDWLQCRIFKKQLYE